MFRGPSPALRFDNFTMSLPKGWTELADEGTYSDPSEGERILFGRPGGTGIFYVTLLPIDVENPPSVDPSHVETLARGWGRARGIKAPFSIALQRRSDGTLASAEYKLAADYVAVWYLSNGESTLHASYICAWKTKEDDRLSRDFMTSSLTFG